MIEERIAALEADRDIRDLKSRYLRACDMKDHQTVRDCFTEDARIRFEGFPDFDNPDDFVAIYRQFGCQPGVFDMHHGANGTIRLTAPDRAEGVWSLYFHNINLAAQTLTQLGVRYEDTYVRSDGRWLIAESASFRQSVLVQSVDGEGRTTIAEMTGADFSL